MTGTTQPSFLARKPGEERFLPDLQKPLHKIVLGDTQFTLYVGLLALGINVVVAVVANLAFAHRPAARPRGTYRKKLVEAAG